MKKEELHKQLESWVASSAKGSGKRYYSKMHPELDDELEFTIRRATIVDGKPVSLEKKFLTASLGSQTEKKAVNDLHKLTVLLDKFDAEYQAILEQKTGKS
jgi:DNA-binding GntR family transcriptional regulator